MYTILQYIIIGCSHDAVFACRTRTNTGPNASKS